MVKTSSHHSVTAITSLYKSEEYLELFLQNCLEQSIFHETFFALNISCPSKYELQMIRKYRPYFKGQIAVKQNSSLIPIYRAWNEMCREANTPYVAIWNVDDLRTPNSLASQLSLMQSGNFRSVAGPFSIVRHFGSTHGIIVNQSESPQSHWIEGMLHGPFFMFQKADLSILRGFDEQFKVAGDFDFAVRLTSLGRVGYTNNLLGYYLNERKGLSTSSSSTLPGERERIYLRYGVVKKIDYSILIEAAIFDFASIYVLGEKYLIQESMENFTQIRNSQLNKATTRSQISKMVRFIFVIIKNRFKSKLKSSRVIKIYLKTRR